MTEPLYKVEQKLDKVLKRFLCDPTFLRKKKSRMEVGQKFDPIQIWLDFYSTSFPLFSGGGWIGLRIGEFGPFYPRIADI